MVPLFQHEEAVFLDDTEKLVGAKKISLLILEFLHICKNLNELYYNEKTQLNPSKMGIELRKHRGD